MNSEENDAEFDPFANDPVNGKSNDSSGRSGAGVAWLALIIALGMVGLNVYQWWQGANEDTTSRDQALALTELGNSQQDIQNTLSSLQSRVDAQDGRDNSALVNSMRSEIDALQNRISGLALDSSGEQALSEAMQLSISNLANRIGDSETSIAALAVRSDSPEKTMDLAEVDYLLRMAGERLALFGDVDSAKTALNLADAQLQLMDDPLYLAVRRKISESLLELDQLPVLDTLQVSAGIAALQSAIPGLPFPGETPVEVIVEDHPDAGLWQKIKNAIKPLVKVRRRVDENSELTIEDKDFLRQGLWLQLESARLALMRKDVTAWEYSLSRAGESLAGRFDAASRAVQSASASLEELKQVELSQELPDISSAWRHLKLLREGHAQPSAGVPAPVNYGPQAVVMPEESPAEQTDEPTTESPVDPPADPDADDDGYGDDPDDGSGGDGAA